MNRFIETVESRTLLSALPPMSAFPADPTFGATGVAAFDGPMAVQSDGKILVDERGSGNIVRLNSDGSLDSTFNSAGVVDDWEKGAARQSDGKLLRIVNGVLMRYNADGSVDQTFGTNGQVSSFHLPANFTSFTAQDVALQGNQIIVGGEAVKDGSSTALLGVSPVSYAVERLNSNGSSDTSFGLHYAYDSGVDSDTLTRVRVLSSGQIVAAGYDTDDNADIIDFGVAGADGSAGTNYRINGAGSLLDMAVRADGKLAAVGQDVSQRDRPPIIAIVDPSTFNFQWGVVYGPGEYRQESAQPDDQYLAVAPDGRILVSGPGDNNAGDPDRMLRLIAPDEPVPAGFVMGTLSPNGFETPTQAYVDLNNDGVYETGEPIATADYVGSYVIGGLAPGGTYTVREVPQPGEYLLTPASGSYSVTLDNSGGARGLDFIASTAGISGMVAKENGATPAGVGYITVYIDQNNNGQLDSGEQSTISYPGGDYQIGISQTLPATFAVRIVVPSGYQQVNPTGAQSVTLTPQQPADSSVDFLLQRSPAAAPPPTDTGGSGTPTPTPSTPTTIAGFKTLLASDRVAISQAGKTRNEGLATLKKTLKSDQRAYSRAKHQLSSAQHAVAADMRRGNLAAAESLNSSIASMQPQLANQAQAVSAAQSNLSAFLDSSAASLAAARHKLQVDTAAYHSFLRTSESK